MWFVLAFLWGVVVGVLVGYFRMESYIHKHQDIMCAECRYYIQSAHSGSEIKRLKAILDERGQTNCVQEENY